MPELAPETVIHEGSWPTLQGQFDGAVTFTVTLPPDGGNDWPPELKETGQAWESVVVNIRAEY